jgi:hypothetical protein
MGRSGVGGALRGCAEGGSPSAEPRRGRGNSGSFDANKANLEAGSATRFKRKTPLPSPGDRFVELTVVRVEGHMVRVQCSCGAPAHLVYNYNLNKGTSTRCNVCAKKKAGAWRKNFWAYADIVPDDDHRRRLLNRISAATTRCHSPTARQYPTYGGRGIHVWGPWRKDRRAFLTYLVSLEGWDKPAFDLDRIDVNKGYEPGNLRFLSAGENRGGNKRTVASLQLRIHELEARIRHLECRPSASIHDPD